MTRINRKEDLLFPVELRPIYSDIEVRGKTSQIEIPNNRVVVNSKTGRPLGVVSKSYKLITNEEAIGLGVKCCTELFGAQESRNIEVFQVDAPSTASYCHIDLVHKDYVMNLCYEQKKSDIYIPYVRITNSYNTSRALRFDVGFCRRLCLNGVIFEHETIKFTFSHTQYELNRDISFVLENGKMKVLFDKFTSYVEKLNNYRISGEQAMNLVLALYGIKDESEIDFESKYENRDEYNSLLREIYHKLNEYFDNLGANAYSLFNLITDLASHPLSNRYFRRDVNSMQRLAGNWLNTFQEEIEKKDFSIDNHINLLRQPSKGFDRFTNLVMFSGM